MPGGTALIHGIAKIDEGMVDVGEPDKALSGKLNFKGGIDRESDGGGEGDDIKPVSWRRHAISGQKGAAKAEGEQEQEDDDGRMHLEGILASGRDVDHIVEGGEKELFRVRAGSGRRCGSDGPTPYLALKPLALGRNLLVDGVEEVEARGGVVAEELMKLRLRLCREQIEPEEGSANIVGLLNEELAMGIVPGDRSGEGEGQQQAKESKDRAFNSGAFGGAFAAKAKAASKLQQQEHGRKEEKSKDGREDHGFGVDDNKLPED